MAVWILTIGNSDIALKSKDTWLTDYEKTSAFTQYGLYDVEPTEIPGEYGEYTAPARSVGEIYTPLLEDEELRELALEEDLTFPLIENYSGELQSRKLELEKIFVLLSDQSTYFGEDDRRSDNSPYWKDTITLWPILQQRLASKFPDCEVCQVVLEPEDRGLDHWDSTLTLVKEKIKSLKIPASTEIYVSHQAGTPAMSSALQFVCLSLFGSNVKFLVSNEYTKQPDLLPSSKYLKGVKLEQAKQLIRRGEPGAGLTLIKGDIARELQQDLEKINARINLRDVTGGDQQEFEPIKTGQRLDDTLDLAELLLKNGKYALAVTILAAAHETFLKAVIKYHLHRYSETVLEIEYEYFDQYTRTYKFEKLRLNPKGRIQWNERGLFLTNVNSYSGEKISNQKALAIYKKLLPNLQPWLLLEWIGKFKRDHDSDLRNQFMHNLRGVTETDAIQYLTAQSASSNLQKFKQMGILKVYKDYIQQPFRDALCDTGLRDKDRTENLLEKALHDLADRLN